jgi:hypothetical protein
MCGPVPGIHVSKCESGQRLLIPHLLQVGGHDGWIGGLLCGGWLGELEQRERDGSGRQRCEHGGE